MNSEIRDGRPVLVISHHPGISFRTRSLEIARVLSRSGPTYYLDWEVVEGPGFPARSGGATGDVVAKAGVLARGLLRRISVREREGLSLVRLPKLLLIGRGRTVRWFNALQLERVLARFGIRHVLNANFYYFPLGRHPGGRYVYDVVDAPAHPDPGKERAIDHFIRHELHHADQVSCCSGELRAELERRYGVSARTIPNGTHPFVAPPPEKRDELKRRLGLGDEPVFIITGRFGWWSGLELLEAAFERLRQQETFRDARLLIVGPGEAAEELKRRRAGDAGYLVTGPVPPSEIPAYLHLARVGVLPSVPGEFRHHAFPIKILEYTAARLPVVATPLRELERIALPNTRLVPDDAERWAEALEKAFHTTWHEAWDGCLAPYDWNRIGERFEALLFGTD